MRKDRVLWHMYEEDIVLLSVLWHMYRESMSTYREVENIVEHIKPLQHSQSSDYQKLGKVHIIQVP